MSAKTYALRVSFRGFDPVDMPISSDQGPMIASLLKTAKTDPGLDATIRGQLDAGILAALSKRHPDAGLTLESVAAARPELEVIVSD